MTSPTDGVATRPLTPAQHAALLHLASPPSSTRPQLQSYSDWRFEQSSSWRFIPGTSARTRAWLVAHGYAEKHPSSARELYYAYRITDLGRALLNRQ